MFLSEHVCLQGVKGGLPALLRCDWLDADLIQHSAGSDELCSDEVCTAQRSLPFGPCD